MFFWSWRKKCHGVKIFCQSPRISDIKHATCRWYFFSDIGLTHHHFYHARPLRKLNQKLWFFKNAFELGIVVLEEISWLYIFFSRPAWPDSPDTSALIGPWIWVWASSCNRGGWSRQWAPLAWGDYYHISAQFDLPFYLHITVSESRALPNCEVRPHANGQLQHGGHWQHLRVRCPASIQCRRMVKKHPGLPWSPNDRPNRLVATGLVRAVCVERGSVQYATTRGSPACCFWTAEQPDGCR